MIEYINPDYWCSPVGVITCRVVYSDCESAIIRFPDTYDQGEVERVVPLDQIIFAKEENEI